MKQATESCAVSLVHHTFRAFNGPNLRSAPHISSTSQKREAWPYFIQFQVINHTCTLPPSPWPGHARAAGKDRFNLSAKWLLAQGLSNTQDYQTSAEKSPGLGWIPLLTNMIPSFILSSPSKSWNHHLTCPKRKKMTPWNHHAGRSWELGGDRCAVYIMCIYIYYTHRDQQPDCCYSSVLSWFNLLLLYLTFICYQIHLGYSWFMTCTP